MVITCNKCNTTYNIKASKIPAPNVMATCKKCGNKFRVNRKSTPKPMPEPSIPDPVPPQPSSPVSIPMDVREKQLGLKPLAGLTKAVRVLLMINIAVIVVAIFAGIYEYHTYRGLPPDVDINETFLLSEAVAAIVGLIQLVLFIILGVTFLRWIYRTNKNLGAISGQPMSFTPGWSVGWYFIPFMCLIKPYQAMKEIWDLSHKNQSVTSSILGLWWALWLISSFFGEFTFKAIMGADSVTEYSSSTMTNMVCNGIDVVLSIVALMLVTRIGYAYSKNYSQQDASAGGYSPAQRPSPPDLSNSPTPQAS